MTLYSPRVGETRFLRQRGRQLSWAWGGASDAEEEEAGEAEEVDVRLPQNRCCRCAYPSDANGRDKTVRPKAIRYNRGGQKSGKAKRGTTNLRMGQVAARQTLRMCLPFRCKWEG